MKTGVIKVYHRDRGFGFITTDGMDYFFHYKDCKEYKEVRRDDPVTYNTADATDKRLRAINVRRA